MGFSVSGSYAIIAVGTFIAIGMFYGAASNGAEQVTDAQSSTYDDRLERKNTALQVVSSMYNTSENPSALSIEVLNTGSTALEISTVDYLVDNELVTHTEISNDQNSSEAVDGDVSTGLWLPGETLEVEISVDILQHISEGVDQPKRVSIVSGQGVTVSSNITVN